MDMFCPRWFDCCSGCTRLDTILHADEDHEIRVTHIVMPILPTFSNDSLCSKQYTVRENTERYRLWLVSLIDLKQCSHFSGPVVKKC